MEARTSTTAERGAHRLETLSEAIERLELEGFTRSFRAVEGGRLVLEGADRPPVAPEDLRLEETVRFEGPADPADEAVVYALSSKDGSSKGTFVTAFGPSLGPDDAAAVQRLTDARRERRQRGADA
jgi:hypothetical protein